MKADAIRDLITEVEDERHSTILLRLAEKSRAELTAIKQRMADLERQIAVKDEALKTAIDAIRSTPADTFGHVPDKGVHECGWLIRDELADKLCKALSSEQTGVAVLTLEQLRELEWAGQVNDRGYQTCPSCHEGKDGAHCANCWLDAKIKEVSDG